MPKRFGSHFRHNMVAYLALFFALGGTAIAAKPLITGADVQDASLTGADVSDDSTLKGVDIDESNLGQVPSAANADNADQLDGKDASELDGEETCRTNASLEVPEADGVVAETVCTVGSLELQATCTTEITSSGQVIKRGRLNVKNTEPTDGTRGILHSTGLGSDGDGLEPGETGLVAFTDNVTIDGDNGQPGSFWARLGGDAVAGIFGLELSAGKCSFVVRAFD